MVCAHKLILSFEKGCKTLSVTYGDSSPKGRAKSTAESFLIMPNTLATGFKSWLPLRGKTSPAPGEDVAQRQKGESGTPSGVTERFTPINKNRQRRGKEEKAALAVYENSQTFAAVRRWLVVCPLPWLLPRISRGQCFLKGPRRPVPAGDARFSLPAWHLGRMFFCSSLTAPLLYRIKMEFLCEEFEQIENKRSRCTSFCTAAPFFTIFL